ncbi:MAG: hypothetical protein K0R17_1674 [Rariglobus sp.]|nr:hypothetical protein [Rariglobus sp.]
MVDSFIGEREGVIVGEPHRLEAARQVFRKTERVFTTHSPHNEYIAILETNFESPQNTKTDDQRERMNPKNASSRAPGTGHIPTSKTGPDERGRQAAATPTSILMPIATSVSSLSVVPSSSSDS